MLEKGCYQNINVGIHTPNMHIDFGDWSIEKFQTIFSALDDESTKMAM